MRELRYSPNAVEKLREIKKSVAIRFGAQTAEAVIKKMTKSLRELQQFPEKGSSVENMLGIPCDYRMLYVQHNYAFYRVEADTVWITDIYNEREDFMWQLFGIKTTSQETEDHWDES